MQTIVVGIDTERPSRTALDWVIERTAISPASIRLVTVAGDRPLSTKRAERDMAAAAQRVSKSRPGLPLEMKLVVGAGIADMLEIEGADADLLVVGHHRKRIVRSLVAGALPSQIAAHAPCPVVIVPHDWLRRFGKVVVGIDADGSSDGALEFAAREAVMTGRSLDIVRVRLDLDNPGSSRVIGPVDIPAERAPEVKRAVELARAGRRSLAVRTFSVHGDPDWILRAHGRDAALVVIGSHGRGAIDAVVRGARAYDFMNASMAPLCVVPADWRAKTSAEWVA